MAARTLTTHLLACRSMLETSTLQQLASVQKGSAEVLTLHDDVVTSAPGPVLLTSMSQVCHLLPVLLELHIRAPHSHHASMS